MAIHTPHGGMLLRLCGLLSLFFLSFVSTGNGAEKDVEISRLPPDPRGGQAYRLTYHVPLPIEIFWRFKTDFDNTFLESNKYILKHRLISSDGDVAVTEDIYSSAPSERFHWRTRVVPNQHRLEFELIDTKAHNHKFHYGVIQLQAMGEATKVTQTAFFDFFGATLWAAYPWAGGMRAFLKYTAEWEQETAVRLRHLYASPHISNSTIDEELRDPNDGP